MTSIRDGQVERTPTGIDGLETVTRGGLPADRMTLVSGTSGSGKTVLGSQFLLAGVRQFDEPGVFVSLDQTAEDLLSNLGGFNWDLEQAIEEDRFIVLDASPSLEDAEIPTGEHDLDGLLVRIRHAVESNEASRVVIDAVNTLADAYDGDHLRRILRRIRALFRELGVTAIATTERLSESQPELTRYGLESFVGDALVVLRNNPIHEGRRRTLEVVKLRGGDHQTGQVPFAIIPGEGIRVIPLAATPLDHPALGEHIRCGIDTLDEMLEGGVRRRSITVSAGPTGSGKTLLACTFANAGIRSGERVLYVTFEESREQLVANALGIGLDGLSGGGGSGDGALRVVSSYPESRGIVEHLLDIQDAIDAFEPDRLAVDGLAALQALAPQRAFREFLIGLNTRVKREGLTAWYTVALPLFYDRGQISMVNLSSMADNLLLTRYVQKTGQTVRTLAVIKTRGSGNDPTIRAIEMTGEGIQIGEMIAPRSGEG